MKKKFLASALAASMVGTMFAMPAFAEEESSSAAAEEATSATAEVGETRIIRRCLGREVGRR